MSSGLASGANTVVLHALHWAKPAQRAKAAILAGLMTCFSLLRFSWVLPLGAARTLACVFAALLATACAREPDTLQDTYASMQDCIRDWGAPDLCVGEPDKSMPRAPDGRPMGGKRGMHFYGPRYVAAERAQIAVGDESASRRLATQKGGKSGKLVRATDRN
jgi:hypothetical protein